MRQKNNPIKKYAALCCILLPAAILAGCAGTSTGSRDSADAALSSPAAKSGASESADAVDTQAQETDASAFPAFTATDLDGNTVTESIFTEKDLTVLNIWGTFCGPCIGEMPELGKWAKEMPDNVQIVGLIIDINGEEDTEHRDLAIEITAQSSPI